MTVPSNHPRHQIVRRRRCFSGADRWTIELECGHSYSEVKRGGQRKTFPCLKCTAEEIGRFKRSGVRDAFHCLAGLMSSHEGEISKDQLLDWMGQAGVKFGLTIVDHVEFCERAKGG